MTGTTRPVGELLRDWRRRRRMSQMDLALDAEISTKHLSFLETGRSVPSRSMVLRLAEHLAVPFRERNVLLSSAGFAPLFPERTLDDPELQAARACIDTVLAGHAPYPALAIDRRWIMVAANAAVAALTAGVEPLLLRPPVNVLRVSLHPAGLAPRIINLAEWRAHVLERLRRQIELSADPGLIDLAEEIRDYPLPPRTASDRAEEQRIGELPQIAVPLRLATIHGTLSFFSTVTVFGTPVDITLSELAIESFLPADAETTATMRRLAEAAAPGDDSGLALQAATAD
ncbi:MAG TPA: helix-turn-helix transcriptional regulator [Acetobacteraceae bacterium]|nr:helix-turn-helix transcriptional regulator [Acetobacteraceae bacterium]